MNTLTPKEQMIFDFIKTTLRENGYSPSIRDIRTALNIKSTSTVHTYLERLERKGYIQRLSVTQDARLKQLVLTREGADFHEKTVLSFHQMDEYVTGLLTEEENAQLLRLLNKLREKLQ